MTATITWAERNAALDLPGIGSANQDSPAPPEAPSARRFEFFVVGEPRAKGSKTAFAFMGQNGKPRAVVTDSVHKNPSGQQRLKNWNQAVTAAAMAAFGELERLDAPVDVTLVFYLARPQGHMGSGKHAGQLKASAPRFKHAVKPDFDKLARSTVDALKIAMLFDDSRIWRCTIEKRYADGSQRTGCAITVEVSP